MNTEKYLYSINLPKKYEIEEIEIKLNINFKKTLENSYININEDFSIMVTAFNVISILALNKNEAKKILLDIIEQFPKENLIYQSYYVEFNNEIEKDYIINNESIILKEEDNTYLQIILLTVAQSVGLEKYELQMDDVLEESGKIIQDYDHSIKNRKYLQKFIKDLSIMRHEMWKNLLLLDKPLITWENEDIEKLYIELENIFELKNRYNVIEYKMGHLKEEVETLMNYISHKHSEFLEWIIIWLIVFEVIMGLIEFFNK